MNIYKKICELCLENKITIKDLERELNFSNGIIGKWKTSSPNIKYLMDICRYFNVSIEELCYETEPTKDQELLHYYHESDERGKENILNLAAHEAKRSQEKELKPFA